MNGELSRDVGWNWYEVWYDDGFQRLSEYPLAKRGRVEALLVSMGSCIYVCFYKEHKFGYSPAYIKRITCRTVSELDNVKHQLLNMGFKIDWYNYQLILQMFTEHYKVYAPYIPDKQQDDYSMKGLKQFSYL